MRLSLCLVRALGGDKPDACPGPPGAFIAIPRSVVINCESRRIVCKTMSMSAALLGVVVHGCCSTASACGQLLRICRV